MPRYKIDDRVTYISGWDESVVPCVITKVISRDDAHPLEKQNTDALWFYEVLADDGHITTLPEASINPA